MRRTIQRAPAGAASSSCGTLTIVNDDEGGGINPPWEVRAATLTSASEPLTAGDTVELRVEAENKDDDSETLVIDGSQVTGGTKECRVKVNGTQVATITFRAEINTTVSTTLQVQVPDADSMSVAVCGATSGFNVESAPKGVFEIGSVALSTEGPIVGESLTITTELLCTGGPGDDPCPPQQYTVKVDGTAIKSEEIGPWNIAQTGEVSAQTTMNSAGDKTITVEFGDATKQRTVTVQDDGGGGPPDDGGGGDGGTNVAVVGVAVLAIAYLATRGSN